jgi:outer membrane protein
MERRQRGPMLTAGLLAAILTAATSMGQARTPPIAPKLTETPLPPPVELPGPQTVDAEVTRGPLTAQEAAELALHRQPSLNGAAANLDAAQARTQQLKAGLGPSVDVTAAGGGLLTGRAVVGASGLIDGYQFGGSARKLLYDYNHTRDLVHQSLAVERGANAALTQAQSDLVFLVKQAFYAYVQNVRLVRVSEANVRNQQDHLALAQALLNSGLGLPVDVVRAQTAVADAIFGLNQARNNAGVARVNLAELIGVDPRTPVEASEESEPFTGPTDLPQLTDLALQQRPEMIAAQASLDAAKLGLSAARTVNAPEVYGSVGVADRGSQIVPPGPTVGISVSVQWTPVDSGFRAGAVKQAQAAVVTAQSQLDTTRLAVISDVAQAYLNVLTAEQRSATSAAEVANAQEALRLAEGRYRGGVGVFLDVLDAQTALDTANVNRVNARSAIDQAQAALFHAVGTPNTATEPHRPPDANP